MLLAATLCLAVQSSSSDTIELQLAAPSAASSWTAPANGRLFLHATADSFDPQLTALYSNVVRVEDLDSGGRSTAALELHVEHGQQWSFVVSDEDGAGAGERAKLHLRFVEESRDMLELAVAAGDSLALARSSRDTGDLDEARATCKAVIVSLLEEPSTRIGPSAVDTLRELAAESHELGDYEPALLGREAVLTRLTEWLPEDHLDLQAAREDVAADLAWLGREEEALGMNEVRLAALERALPKNDERVLDARVDRATNLSDLSRTTEAAAEFEAVLEVLAVEDRLDSDPAIHSRNNLGRIYYMRGDTEGALELWKAACDSLMRTRGPGDPDLATIQHNLAAAYQRFGDLDAALAIQLQVLENSETAYPIGHEARIDARNNLGNTLAELGLRDRWLENKDAHERELRTSGTPFQLESYHNNCAFVLSQWGQHDKALEHKQRHYELVLARMEPDSKQALRLLMALADYHDRVGEFDRGLELVTEALELASAKSMRSRETLEARLNRAGSLTLCGRSNEALEELDRLDETLGGRGLGWRRDLRRMSRSQRGVSLLEMGRYGEAYESCVTARQELIEDGVDPGDELLLQIEENLAIVESRNGLLPEAIERLERVADGRRAADHWKLAQTLSNLSGYLNGVGRLEAAENVGREAMELSSEVNDPEHFITLGAMVNLAATLADLGRVEEADALERRVLEIRARELAPDHPKLIEIRMNVACSQLERGRPSEALLEIEELRSRVKESADLRERLGLTTLETYAYALADLGHLTEAAEIQRGVLAEYEKALPESDRKVLRARSNLAATLSELGDAAGALPLAHAVYRSYLEGGLTDHPWTIGVRSNLALILSSIGDEAAALDLAERAARDARERLPRGHSDRSRILTALASVYTNANRQSKAAELLADVYEVQLEIADPSGRPAAFAAANLAGALTKLGEYREAIGLQERALEVIEGALGREARVTIALRANLGQARFLAGDVARGARELEDALARIRAKTPRDPSIETKVLTSLLLLSATEGDAQEVEARATELAEVTRKRLDQLLLTAAPRRAGAAASSFSETVDLIASFALGTGGLDPIPALRDDYLRLHATVRGAPVLAGRIARVGATSNSDAGVLRARAAEASERLSRLATRQVEDSFLEQAIEERDAALEQLREALGDELRVPSFGHEELRARLEEGEALALLHRAQRRTAARGEGPGAWSSAPSYAALIVRTDGALELRDLGAASGIDRLIEDWHAESGMTRSAGDPAPSPPDEGTRGLGEARPTEPSSAASELGAELRARVLDPILEAAGGSTSLYLVLDGDLHGVPWDALPLDDGWVGDRYTFSRLASVGELEHVGEAPTKTRLLAVGDVDYGSTGTRAQSSVKSPVFEMLEGTKVEIERAAMAVQEAGGTATLLSRSAATPASFVAEAQHATHVLAATHGFASLPTWGRTESNAAGTDEANRSRRARLQAPLLSCGLAFAGANLAGTEGDFGSGLLLGEQIVGLDLTRCELAILSACSTAVGDDVGEAVQSLQTAVHAAGARRSIASLWPVEDKWIPDMIGGVFEATLRDREPATVARALWEARQMQRKAGAPFSAWAGWCYGGPLGN